MSCLQEAITNKKEIRKKESLRRHLSEKKIFLFFQPIQLQDSDTQNLVYHCFLVTQLNRCLQWGIQYSFKMSFIERKKLTATALTIIAGILREDMKEYYGIE